MRQFTVMLLPPLFSQSSIIRALEIYTRGSVITTVNEMQLREKEKAVKMSKEPQRVTFESSQRNGSQIYEAVLEDDFDGHTVRRHLLGESNSLGESVDDSSNEDVDESMGEDSDGSSEIEGMQNYPYYDMFKLHTYTHPYSSSIGSC